MVSGATSLHGHTIALLVDMFLMLHMQRRREPHLINDLEPILMPYAFTVPSSCRAKGGSDCISRSAYNI